MDKTHLITVEVVYGLATLQKLCRFDVPAGIQAREAVRLSGIAQMFPEVDFEKAPLGVFGKAVSDDTVLHHHDRVEVYRPLLIDPKEARRQRAAANLTENKSSVE